MAALGLAWDLQEVPERIYEEARATRTRRATSTILATEEPAPIGIELVEEAEPI